MPLQMTSMDELLSGYIGNMSEEQIDDELKLFKKIAKTIGLKSDDYPVMGIIVDHEYLVSDQILFDISLRLSYKPYLEHNQASGHDFLYFRNTNDAEKAAQYIISNLESEV